MRQETEQRIWQALRALESEGGAENVTVQKLRVRARCGTTSAMEVYRVWRADRGEITPGRVEDFYRQLQAENATLRSALAEVPETLQRILENQATLASRLEKLSKRLKTLESIPARLEAFSSALDTSKQQPTPPQGANTPTIDAKTGLESTQKQNQYSGRGKAIKSASRPFYGVLECLPGYLSEAITPKNRSEVVKRLNQMINQAEQTLGYTLDKPDLIRLFDGMPVPRTEIYSPLGYLAKVWKNLENSSEWETLSTQQKNYKRRSNHF